jgi:hypothetical protein
LTYDLKKRISNLHDKDKNISCAAVVRYLKAKEHIKVTTAEFSRYINGIENPPKSGLVLLEADKYVTELEHENV